MSAPEHCGSKIGNLCEYGEGGECVIETECGECDGEILLSRRITVHYTARALK